MILDRPTTIKTLAAQLAARYPHLATKIDKAVALIERRRIWCDTDCPVIDAYLAISSDGVSVYQVLPGACSCAARGLCYHRVARRLLERALEVEREEIFGRAAKETPKPPTIKQDQRRLGEHLRTVANKIPTGATLH